MFWHRKTESLTLDDLDARLRAIEARIARPEDTRTRPVRCGSVECALAELARSGGFRFKPREGLG